MDMIQNIQQYKHIGFSMIVCIILFGGNTSRKKKKTDQVKITTAEPYFKLFHITLTLFVK